MVQIKKNILIYTILSYLVYTIKGLEHQCDFNENHTIEITDTENHDIDNQCVLKPNTFDKVSIICGSKTINYKLYPENCFESVYDSPTSTTSKPLNEILPGAVNLTINNDQESGNKIVSMRIPPNFEENKVIYCYCDNRKNDASYSRKIYEQDIKNLGTVKIIMPVMEKKIDGCDFKKEESEIFTKGININSSEYNNVNDIFCTVEAEPNKLIGFRCPNNYEISPPDCFINAYNFEGKTEYIKNKITLNSLIMDSHKNIYYSKVPSTVYGNPNFFCMCVKDNKKLIAHFNFVSSPKYKPWDKYISQSYVNSNSNYYEKTTSILIVLFFIFSYFML
ncbi:6-cysteine protein [Plasmodium berghei]|uniref:6-cysteine protein P12, putative n=2 Tax=Plasmodium berghei TaxID=5821 RepID=A0A509AED8_PLABA|nr:6-cysteine protein P12, putative [Plasmodium berghei ANKA]CXH83222.1 6-cysteine protein [Plasmodium berghei]SCM19260.1 6-cysteine protein [Plasmodium berghei]SCN21694.1 6-cysteine protein [Plasmodium berghei]SCO58924.1 6-cysteine protein [Plasmodium berghei]SCO58979.1 6-cysteine protein [Plasmodium berghei]|eukprot:XP_034419710.1 6-cysteine protein P12, putative [Plasmodium berghei ANKA]